MTSRFEYIHHNALRECSKCKEPGALYITPKGGAVCRACHNHQQDLLIPQEVLFDLLLGSFECFVGSAWYSAGNSKRFIEHYGTNLDKAEFVAFEKAMQNRLKLIEEIKRNYV